MTAIVTVGIDLPKNVFAVHGIDATGKRLHSLEGRSGPNPAHALGPPCLLS